MKQSIHSQINQNHPNLNILQHTSIISLLTLTTLTTTTIKPTHTNTQKQKKTHTYTLIITHNKNINKNIKPLHYTNNNNTHYYKTFSHLTHNTKLLTILNSNNQHIFPTLTSHTTPPTHKQLISKINTLNQKIAHDKTQNHHVKIYLIFTNHKNIDKSDKKYLSLTNNKLHKNNLYHKIIQPLETNYTHLIIDTCHTYFIMQNHNGKN